MNDPAFWLLFAAVLAPVLTGVATMFLPRQQITTRVMLALSGPAAAIAILAMRGISSEAHSAPFVEQLNLSMSFVTDPLGMFFAMLIAGMGALIILYARGYFGRSEKDLARFYPMLGLFATAMLGLVLSDNFLALFVFWELTSVSSFLLIGWDRHNPRAVRLALQALATTGLGGMALLGGLCALGSATGAWSFTELSHVMHAGGVQAMPNPALLPWAFALIVLGAGAKSAQWPLHFWLPGAMAAPTPVSAYLHSATMVKAGVYLFARLFPMLGASHAALPYWPATLAAIGAVTMLLGGYLALRADELKRIFAYTTVSQLGLLVCMYGVGAVQNHHETILSWPVMQILNHALYKAPLFIIAGAIMHIVGRKYLSQLSGLLRTHRNLAVICLLACYAMAGGPLTLSFIAKETFLHQVHEAATANPVYWIVGVMTVLTAACNVAIFVRFLTTFLAPPEHSHAREADHHHEHAHEHGFWGACIWWPAAFIVAFQFVGGLATPAFGNLIAPVETNAGHAGEGLPSIIHALLHPGVPLAMSLIAIAMGVAVGLSPLFRKTFTDPHDRLFPATTRLGEVVGFHTFFTMQTGNLRTYLIVILTALVAGVGWVMAANPALLRWPAITQLLGGDVGLVTVASFLTFLMCGAAMLIPWIGSRVVRVMILGACGFSVTGMYLVYQAPDLALTQLMFEIISIVLFLLVLRLLPEEPAAWKPRGRAPRLAFASVVGLVIGWVLLHSGAIADQSREAFLADQRHSTLQGEGPVVHDAAFAEPGEQPSERLGSWFQRHSHEGSEATDGRGGGGMNVVNVVVVDFRGYDTLGEITVLGIAMMGVLAMLAGPAFIAEGGRERVLVPQRQPHLRSTLLRTSMPLILPLILLFAGYVFFKGHNEPGGGFIAGLIASVGIVAYRMSEGPHALKRLIPIKPGVLVAIGLSSAAITAITPLLNGQPILTLPHFNIPRLGAEPYHFTGAAFFDLGVMLVVVGCSTGIINRFEEELD